MARLVAAASSLDGPSLLSRLDLPENLVPDLLPPGSVIDRVRTSLPEPFNALAGRPVVMASHDTWSGVVGMGALVAGRAYNVSGTTETFGVMSPQAGQGDRPDGRAMGRRRCTRSAGRGRTAPTC